MRAKIVYVCLALLSFFAHFSVSQPPMNIYQIVEFLLGCTGLMARTDGLRDYASFMDESLRVETEYVFSRIRGFARDETQARQWEEMVRQFISVFILRTIVAQGRAYLDAHFAQSDRNPSEPDMLLEQCARRVAEQTIVHLNQEFEFPRIENEILFYELIHMTRLRVTAIARNTPPYFQLRLGNSVSYRPIDETQPTTLTPYAPLNNFIRDWEALRSVFDRFDYDTSLKKLKQVVNSKTLNSHYVSADVLDFARANVKRFLPQYNYEPAFLQEHEYDFIMHTLVRILVQFLSANYNWLMCHPANDQYAANDVNVKRVINKVGQSLERFRLHYRNLIFNTNNHNTENFQEFFLRHGVVARYINRMPFVLLRFFAPLNTTTCE